MKGAIGFLVGLIGLCSSAALTAPLAYVMRRNEELAVAGVSLIAFIFLNIMVVGFYRMIGHLHETVLYPEDAFHYPQRGRALFFVGYVGLLLTLAGPFVLVILVEVVRVRILGGRQFEVLLVLAWLTGWAFLGCFLGGVLAMLNDVFHKAFYRTAAAEPRLDADDDFDISRRGTRRRDERDRVRD